MLNRRGFLGASAGALTVAAAAPAFAQPAVINAATELMPKGKQPRVVIAGGGWGGLTAARYLREQSSDIEVVVLERNPVFWSCPISNKWLIDVVDSNYLMHDMFAPARKYGYHLIQTEITGIERDKKTVRTHARIHRL